MNRAVLHVDMNAYFASVEQKSNPLLRGKPVLVAPDGGRRAVVVTCSYEARAFGVRTGMNVHEARKLCPQAIVVDGGWEKYLDSTARLLAALESFTDQVEMRSCDEAYLDVTASLKYFRTDGPGLAQRVQDAVRAATGLPCSVGAAPNKLLAKLAAGMRKPDGLVVIRPEDVEKVMAETPVGDMCGVGESSKIKMAQLGIRTCADLAAANEGLLRNHFGFWGHWLKRMGRGLDDAPVRRLSEEEAIKSVGHSTTFPRDTEDPELLKAYLLLLSEKVAMRLRDSGLWGSTVAVTLRYKDFTTFGRQRRRASPTDHGAEIFGTAWKIVESLRPLSQAIRLVGVSVSDLAANPLQDFLFEAMARSRKLDEAADAVNRKFGRLTVKPARVLLAEKHGVLAPPIPPFQHKRFD